MSRAATRRWSRSAVTDTSSSPSSAWPSGGRGPQHHGSHTAFSVRGKTFVWYLDDHHGDGRLAINCKTGLLEQAEIVAADSERYFLPPYMARHGWVGLRLDVGDIDWDEVEDLVTESYRLIAPKRLVASLH